MIDLFLDMRKSTCFTRFFNTTAGPLDGICENPLSLDMTNKLCCCTIGQGWMNPGMEGDPNAEPECQACPARNTGMLVHGFTYIHHHRSQSLVFRSSTNASRLLDHSILSPASPIQSRPSSCTTFLLPTGVDVTSYAKLSRTLAA